MGDLQRNLFKPFVWVHMAACGNAFSQKRAVKHKLNFPDVFTSFTLCKKESGTFSVVLGVGVKNMYTHTHSLSRTFSSSQRGLFEHVELSFSRSAPLTYAYFKQPLGDVCPFQLILAWTPLFELRLHTNGLLLQFQRRGAIIHIGGSLAK